MTAMTNQYNYNETITNRLKELSNRELLEMVYEYSLPDDYDLAFTSPALWCRDESRRVLEERLIACGFIESVITWRKEIVAWKRRLVCKVKRLL